MYSPFITNCVMRGDLSLDACLQGYHLVVGHSADPATWNSQRLLQVWIRCAIQVSCLIVDVFAKQAGSSDETGQDFVLPMLDSVVVQVWRAVATHVAASWPAASQLPRCRSVMASIMLCSSPSLLEFAMLLVTAATLMNSAPAAIVLTTPSRVTKSGYYPRPCPRQSKCQTGSGVLQYR